jgi:hypothetical protein
MQPHCQHQADLQLIEIHTRRLLNLLEKKKEENQAARQQNYGIWRGHGQTPQVCHIAVLACLAVQATPPLP